MPPTKKALSIAGGKFVVDSDGNISTAGGNSAASNTLAVYNATIDRIY